MRLTNFLVLCCFVVTSSAFATNFVEEAYNQEKGEVQHIQSLQVMTAGSVDYTFTEEWPLFNSNHQISVDIPFGHPASSSSFVGVRDLKLNYRYQLVKTGRVAIAPRGAVILPTGDYRKKAGFGSFGFQGQIPISFQLGKHFANHWNFGVTFTPAKRDFITGDHAPTLDFNSGTSIVWFVTHGWHWMFEATWDSAQDVSEDGVTSRKNRIYLSPGMRFVFGDPSSVQVVPGFSVPIGFGDAKKSWGVFAYLSFSHQLF